MKLDFRLEGGAELAAALRELSQAAGRGAARRALTKAAEPIRNRAALIARKYRSNEHRVTRDGIAAVGHLDESIRISNTRQIRQRKLTKDETAVAIGPAETHYYGLFLEFGTVKTPVRAFLRPAFDAGAAQATQDIGRELANEIEKTAARVAKKARV